MRAKSSQRRPNATGQRRALQPFSLAVVATALAAAAAAQEREGDALESNRTALEKYVETRRIISSEKRKWAEGKQMLTDQIEVVKSQIEALRAKITEARNSLTEADEKKAALVDDNRELSEAAAALTGTVAALEARAEELLPRLPEPVRDRVRMLSQQLPENPDQTELSLGKRFQNVVGLLNEINKCNREITITSEVRTLADGTSAEVTALYVGIGQGYYVTAKGDAAGIGTATAAGWTWTPADDAAERIAKTIAILKNEQPADFVRLPIRIE